eukprot:scaffold62046_cov33-Prasinocladus_malaysianus.AAC.1
MPASKNLPGLNVDCGQTAFIPVTADYGHCAKEISRNCKEPLDVFRENISNSMDARASRADIVFFVSRSTGECIGYAYWDDGRGMKKSAVGERDPAIGSLAGFFSIGNHVETRKTSGDISCMGFKCHGYKLNFSCEKSVHVITTTNRKTCGWLCASLNNPAASLGSLQKLSVSTVPGTRHESLADKLVAAIIDAGAALPTHHHFRTTNLKAFFKQEHGTMIICLGQDDAQVNNAGLIQHLGDLETLGANYEETNYAYNYLRLKTALGTPLLFPSVAFPEGTVGPGMPRVGNETTQMKLYLWTKPLAGEGADYRSIRVVPGFPYIECKKVGLSAQELDTGAAYLDPFRANGNAGFQTRRTGRFYVKMLGDSFVEAPKEELVEVILTVDGRAKRTNSKRQKMLNRQGGKRGGKASGHRMADFSGVILYTNAQYLQCFDQLFTDAKLMGGSKYSCLASSYAKKHVSLIINGNFPPVMARDGLANVNTFACEDRNSGFKAQMEKFLSQVEETDEVFRRVVQIANAEFLPEIDMSAYQKRLDSSLALLLQKERVQMPAPGGGFVYRSVPGSLSSLNAVLHTAAAQVPADLASELRACWWMPFGEPSVHAQTEYSLQTFALPCAAATDPNYLGLSNPLPPNPLKTLEMVVTLDLADKIDVSFETVDIILTWDLTTPLQTSFYESAEVEDTFCCYGRLTGRKVAPSGNTYSLTISDIRKQDLRRGENSATPINRTVQIVVLKNLMEATWPNHFKCDYPRKRPSPGSRIGKKRRASRSAKSSMKHKSGARK